MAESIKNQNLGAVPSAQEFNLITLKLNQEDRQRKQVALLLAQLEGFAKEVLEAQSAQGHQQAGNLESKAPELEAGEENETEDSTSQTPEKQQKFGGSNFFVSNNIPFSMFVDMIQERLKQLITQSQTQQMVSLAYAGKNQTVNDDGSVSFSDQEGGGIVDMICASIMAGANAESMGTTLQALGTLTSAVGSIAAGVGAGLKTGDTTAEQNKVDRITNAIAAEKEIPIGNIAGVGDRAAAAAGGGKNAAALDDAIAALTDGDGYTNLQMGSVKTATGGFEKQTADNLQTYQEQAETTDNADRRSYVKDHDTDADKKITAEEAIEFATPPERNAIRARMQKELDKANDQLTRKEEKIARTVQQRVVLLTKIGEATSGGINMFKAGQDTIKGVQNALQQSESSVQGALNKIADNQKQAVDNRKNSIDQANQDLQKIISTVGQRG